MADTGCQSCLAGINAIKVLGLTEKDLIPVSMRMHAANNRGIKILGAVAITFSGESKSGLTLETRQITYVTDSTDKVFLSREACVELGMISQNFPAIGEMHTNHANPVISDSTSDINTAPRNDSKYAPCGCLKREASPPPWLVR